jgi:ankyrin repeat protein
MKPMRLLLSLVVAALTFGPLTPAVAQRSAAAQIEDFALAATNDRDAELKAMIARGMDPNTVGLDGNPVLLTAAREGSTKAVDALLAAGAKPDLRNAFGDSPLLMAALHGRLEIARKLIAKGAPLDAPGWTPLIYAATGGHDEMVRFLLDQGARIDATSPNGTSALMMAVREDKFSTAALLIARGADVNLRNENGATALAWAERSGDRELIQRLKRAGAR